MKTPVLLFALLLTSVFACTSLVKPKSMLTRQKMILIPTFSGNKVVCYTSPVIK